MFLIADDDFEHAAFMRDQVAASSGNLSVSADDASETITYLESLAVHNPTGRPVPCILLLGFVDEQQRDEVLRWVADHPRARPHVVVVMESSEAPGERDGCAKLGADKFLPRFPRLAELAALNLANASARMA